MPQIAQARSIQGEGIQLKVQRLLERGPGFSRENHIRYDPGRRGSLGGQHLSYTVANRVSHNPVYNALKQKGDKLKASEYRGIKGVFLCDASCESLRSAMIGCSSYSVAEIVRDFFRQFNSVDFVATFAVGGEFSHPFIVPKLFVSPKRKLEIDLIVKTVEKIHRLLPAPECSPENAMSKLSSEGGMSGRYFGRLESGGKVKMSARELLEILAGAKTIREFEQNYGMEPHSNPFRQMLDAGRLISKVTVERAPERDDDIVTIEFGPSDAAVAPFWVPQQEGRKKEKD